MTVPIPVTGATITTTWGTQVANDVNGLLSRMTAAETDIDALQTERIGIKAVRSTVAQSIGTTETTLTYQTTVEQNGVAQASGIVTIQEAGIYACTGLVLPTAGGYAYLEAGGAGNLYGAPQLITNTGARIVSPAATVRLVIGDTVRLVCAAASGTMTVFANLEVWKVAE